MVMEMSSLLAPAARDNPYPFYEAARRTRSVLYIPTPGVWGVFGYEDCRTILRDARRFSSVRPVGAAAELPAEERGESMLASDPPRHTQLRDLVNRAFTPRMVANLEPRIREITGGILDNFGAAGQIDLIEDLAYPLPVIMIAEIMGVPPEDRAAIKRWSDVIAENLGAGLAGSSEPPEQTLVEMRTYFTQLIEHHRARPADDLISALVAAEIEGEKLSLPNLIAFCVLLLVAGNETTTNLIGNAMRLLTEQPEAWQRLCAEPALWSSAIEEVLRYRPPVQMTSRLTTEDVELGGETIRSGNNIIVFLASANRDPAEFANPELFDITREPNRHLSFGLGIHFCLGAPLARLEAKVALTELSRRFPSLRRSDGRSLDPLPGIIMHGVKNLPLEFDPA